LHLKEARSKLMDHPDDSPPKDGDEFTKPLMVDLAVPEIRRGDRCPMCQQGVMDYDGLLNLACPVCGYTLGGCFT